MSIKPYGLNTRQAISSGASSNSSSGHAQLFKKRNHDLNQTGAFVVSRTAERGSADTPGKGSLDPRDSCCWQGQFFFDALKAILTRLMFLAHAMLAVWRVTFVTRTIYWMFSLAYVGMLAEAVFILVKRRGQEWTWFQWSIFLYLCAVVPPIWMLELTNLGQFNNLLNNTLFAQDVNQQLSVELLDVGISSDDWTTVIQQGLLVVLIIGRWLMPKGDLSREQLSALLLTYLGTASDIVDFMSLLLEPTAATHTPFLYAVLFCWTWSLLQFPFVVTSVTKDNQAFDADEEEEDDLDDLAKDKFGFGHGVNEIEADGNVFTKLTQKWRRRKLKKAFKDFFETEAWGIFVSVVLQDGPFVIMRMISILNFQIKTYTNYFFTAKNTLVLLLQVYRLWSIYHEHRKKKQIEQNKKGCEKINDLYKTAFDAKTNVDNMEAMDKSN